MADHLREAEVSLHRALLQVEKARNVDTVCIDGPKVKRNYVAACGQHINAADRWLAAWSREERHD